MAMYLVKRLTSEILIQRLQDKGGRSSEDTKNYIIKKFSRCGSRKQCFDVRTL